jgi:hypothetical protein
LSLSHGSRIIADTKVQSVSGRKGIGTYQLRFSVELVVPAWPNEPNTATLRNMRSRIFAGAGRGDVQYLGIAEAEAPLAIQPTQYSQQQGLLFDLDLTPQQLFALEEIRNGGDLYFVLHLMGETQGMHGALPAHDDIHYHVTLSDWARVLRELDYDDILVVGVVLPQVGPDSKVLQAVTLIRQAHGDLHFGRYDAVVNRCRHALDSIHIALGEKDAVNVAVEKFKNQRRMMTKLERELLIGEVARHYTQLAHHVDGQGEPEWYSRSDALFLLGFAAAAVCSAVNREEAQKAQDSAPKTLRP